MLCRCHKLRTHATAQGNQHLHPYRAIDRRNPCAQAVLQRLSRSRRIVQSQHERGKFMPARHAVEGKSGVDAVPQDPDAGQIRPIARRLGHGQLIGQRRQCVEVRPQFRRDGTAVRVQLQCQRGRHPPEHSAQLRQHLGRKQSVPPRRPTPERIPP